MDIREYREYKAEDVLRLYASVGWTAYTDDPAALERGFRHSLLVLAAWEDGELAGLIRAVGDGATIVFIQDILVAPERQRRGIGTALLRAVLERFNGVRQIELDDLREMAFGKFEGRPVKELVHDEDFKKWITPGSGYLPEGAEPTEQFHARCADSLMKLFEYMIRMDVTEAACVTHGGVIMSMLSQRAVPTRRPEQWMADPGCGYTVQTDVQLWMRDKLVEAIDIVPFGYADTLQGQAEAEENEAYE